MKKTIIVLLAVAILSSIIGYVIKSQHSEERKLEQMAAIAKNYDDSPEAKYAAYVRKEALLRRDDKTVTDSDRLAGIEYQLTLLRIATEERAR